jgi:hypothetical protein
MFACAGAAVAIVACSGSQPTGDAGMDAAPTGSELRVEDGPAVTCSSVDLWFGIYDARVSTSLSASSVSYSIVPARVADGGSAMEQPAANTEFMVAPDGWRPGAVRLHVHVEMAPPAGGFFLHVRIATDGGQVATAVFVPNTPLPDGATCSAAGADAGDAAVDATADVGTDVGADVANDAVTSPDAQDATGGDVTGDDAVAQDAADTQDAGIAIDVAVDAPVVE